MEKNTEAFIKDLQAKGGKPIYKHTPKEAREILEKLQSGPAPQPDVKMEEKKIHSVKVKKDFSIHIVRPKNASEPLPVILYIHGGGWVLGSFSTHERLVRELCVGSHAAVVFVDYSRSPEAQFPIAIEQCYTALQYVYENAKTLHLDTSHVAVAGDSVGGNTSIALALLCKERKGPKIDCEVLFYPVTSSDLNTASYTQFSEGPWLTKAAMEWFWNAYEPDVSSRKRSLISPLHASIDELKGFPPTLLITDENDVLRDEGEQFASKLMQAGVEVTATRFLGTIHDFAMLNALAHTPAARTAITLCVTYLHEAFTKHAKKLKGSKKAA